MQAYKVILKVAVNKLPTLLSVIQGTPGIELVNVVTDEEAGTGEGSTKRVRNGRYHGGKRFKGISAHDLVLKVLNENNGPVTFSAMEKAFKSHGFSVNSLSPAVSVMKGKQLMVDNNRITLLSQGKAK